MAKCAPLPARWLAKWISPVEPTPQGTSQDTSGGGPQATDRPVYLLAGKLVLHSAVASATLHATALGIYEVFINGTRVGDEELTPGSTNYATKLYAQAYDVLHHLQPGTNCIEILLSDGWYRGRNGGMQHQDAWGPVTAALAQFTILHLDGTTIITGTDDTWTSQPSQIVRADLMRGQSTDYTHPDSDPQPVHVGRVSAPVPTSSPAPPVRRITRLSPLRATPISPTTTILDFGQNIAGWLRLSNLGPAGARTTLTHGEHVNQQADLDTGHLDIHTPHGEHVEAHQVDTVITDGRKDRVFEPRHTVHGFRYVRVDHPGRTFDPADAEALVVHTDLQRTGHFTSSDERLERLHEAAVWSFRGNAVDVPTDCPTRERSAWTGDYQIFAPTAAILFDIEGFSRKWLTAVRDDQYDDGSLAMFSPDSERLKLKPEDPNRFGGGSAGWGDAIIAVPWTIWQHYDTTRVLTENWPAMVSWINFALRSAREHRHASRVERSAQPAEHEQYLWDGTFHFGEWLEPQPATDPNADGETDAVTDPAALFHALLAADHGEVGTAFLYRSTAQLAAIAEVLGKHEEARIYRAIAAEVRRAWRTEFMTPDGHTRNDTQAAYVRAIDFGLIPDDLIPAAADRLVELIHAADDTLTTGFLATGSLLQVLADTGHENLAYTLLTQTKLPSWLGMLERGATTFWEHWDGINDAGEASGSLNHYSKGAAMRFLYSHVVGLQQAPASHGWREVIIRPVPGPELTYAEAQLDTIRGLIEVSWTRSHDLFTLTVTIPERVTASAVLPDGTTVTLPRGTSVLSCPAPQLAQASSS